MIQLNDIEKGKYKSDRCPKNIKVVIDKIPNATEKVLNGTLRISESVMDDVTEFAGCISCQAEFTVRVENIGDVTGSKVQIKGAVITEVGAGKEIPYFYGYIDSADYNQDTKELKVVAYDALYFILDSTTFSDGTLVYKWYKDLFKSSYAKSGWITLKNIRNLLFEKMDIEQTYNAWGDLPNDGIKVKKRFKNKDMTLREILKGLCQINGCFGIMNREGKFEWRYVSSGKLVRSFSAYPGCFYPGTMYPSEIRVEEKDIGAEEEITVIKDMTYSNYQLNPIADKISCRNNPDDSGQYVNRNQSDSKHYYKRFVTIADDDTDRDKDDPSFGDDDDEMVTGAYVLEGNMWAYKLKNKNKKIAIANMMQMLGDGTGFRTYSITTYGMPYLECGDRIKINDKVFIITNREIEGDQVMWDTFSCTVDYEAAEYITTSQPSVAKKTSIDEEEVKQIATDTATDVATDISFDVGTLAGTESGTKAGTKASVDTIDKTFKDEQGQKLKMLVEVSFIDGVLKTKTVEITTPEEVTDNGEHTEAGNK